ncbi:hypothetical protein [Peribacillus asahii]|uniref:hypothetical protein n=1 Tax=Peribacillus asahii TaxID=228899 RepID=UPI003800537E
MTTLTKAKEKLNHVQLLRGNDGLGFFTELLTEFRGKKSEIRKNSNLTTKGQNAQIEKLSAVYERKILELASQVQESGRNAALEAKQIAESHLISELPPVDDRRRALWAQEAERLEAAVKFAVTPKRAMDALQELVETADEPALANEIKSKMLKLSDQVINNASPQERPAMRLEIGKLYNQVAKQALPEDSHEAKEIIDMADRMLATSNIPSMIDTAAREVSLFTSTFLHNPDERLAVLNAPSLSPQKYEKQEHEETLDRLAERAKRTASTKDKIAYVKAKREIAAAQAGRDEG